MPQPTGRTSWTRRSFARRSTRQVVVDIPDVKERELILRLHARKLPLTGDVDSRACARYAGSLRADLANLVNEAALFAGAGKDAVDMDVL